MNLRSGKCTESSLVWNQLTTLRCFEDCGVQRFHCQEYILDFSMSFYITFKTCRLQVGQMWVTSRVLCRSVGQQAQLTFNLLQRTVNKILTSYQLWKCIQVVTCSIYFYPFLHWYQLPNTSHQQRWSNHLPYLATFAHSIKTVPDFRCSGNLLNFTVVTLILIPV